jgi:hypothetical protein
MGTENLIQSRILLPFGLKPPAHIPEPSQPAFFMTNEDALRQVFLKFPAHFHLKFPQRTTDLNIKLRKTLNGKQISRLKQQNSNHK